jgi:hypothetical protein
MREPGEGDATTLVWGRRDKVSIFFCRAIQRQSTWGRALIAAACHPHVCDVDEVGQM